MANVIYVPSTKLIGRGCLREVGSFVDDLVFKTTFIVADKFLHESGFVDKVAE